MPRTTETAVRKIIELSDTFDVETQIELANEVVTDACETSGYSETRLEAIERWLTAHFCACIDPRAMSESVKGVSTSYQMVAGKGLEATTYGQQVKLLDTKGAFARLDKQSKDGSAISLGVYHVGRSLNDLPTEESE